MKRRQSIMRSTCKARSAWSNHVKQLAQAEGIPDSYRPVLMYLHRTPGASQRSIAEFAGVTASATNQVVKNMVEEAYLRKETDQPDRRSTRLYLTEKGEAVALRLHEKLEQSDDAITAFLGQEKEAEMIELMERLSAFIQEELEQC